MQFLSAERQNPFGMSPPCDQYVAGYGDTTADFHVVGDHPGVHGGTETGVPFTGKRWSERLFRTLERADLVRNVDLQRREVAHGRTFFSYLHMCLTDHTPTAEDYVAMEPFFDAELRAITAHVLLPVGARATAHVLDTYTARASGDPDMDALHGSDIRGSGWLVVPIKEPAEWSDGDARTLVDGLVELQSSDYQQLSDLGRFFPDDDPYLVR